jgi:hypothetical protein
MAVSVARLMACVLEVVDKQAQMFPMCRVLVQTIVYLLCISNQLWEEMEEDVLLDLNPRQRFSSRSTQSQLPMACPP